MAAAESAPVGQNEPAESFFDGISAAYTSKFDRPAIRTTYREHSSYISLPAGVVTGLRSDFRF